MHILLFLLSFFLLTGTQAQKSGAEWLEAAKASMKQRQYETALDQLIQSTTADPQLGEAWYQLAWCYNELGQHEKAFPALEKAKQQLGVQARIYFETGYAYQKTDHPEQAKENYVRTIELKPDYGAAYRELATIQYETDHDFLAALDNYRKYVQVAQPGQVSALHWFRKAYCEVEANLPDSAIVSTQNSIAVDSNFIDSWNELGYVYYATARANEAVAAYQQSLRIDNKNAAAYKGLGDVYRMLTHQSDLAYPHYLKAVEYNPRNPAAHFGLAWCYNERNEFEKAVESLQQCITLDNGEPYFHAELGYAYYGQKKWDLALIAIDRALAIQEIPLAHYYRGLIFVAQKDKTKAEEAYQKLKAAGAPEAETLRKKIDNLN